MKVLVAGAQGQVARALAELDTRHDIIALGRPDLDLTDDESVRGAVARRAPDIVINAAAYTAVDRAEDDEAACFAVNADGAGRLAQAAAEAGAGFLHLSTDYVYDGTKPAPYVESDPIAPLGVYGRSKAAGEEAVRGAHPGAIILRTAWVYASEGTNFVRTMLRLAGTTDQACIVGDQIGCPTYAPDIAVALIAIAEQRKEGGVFHLAGVDTITWFGFASAIFLELGRRGWQVPRLEQIATSEYPTRARRPANSRLDASKLAMTYGLRLPGWREALPRCLDRILGPRGA